MSIRAKQGCCWPSAVSIWAIALLPLGAAGLAQMPAATRGTDVTEKLENLGNPFSKIRGSTGLSLYRGLTRGKKWNGGQWIYARNIWDMHVFEGRLYLGAGSARNSAPARNAGPVPIVCYDPTGKSFVKEGTVDGEQIDVYYMHEGRLYIPGCDPIQDWRSGNFYCRQDNGRWKKHRNIPGALHMFAMAWHEGRVFGALGTRNGAAVSISSDQGRTWTVVQTGGGRVYGFLTVGSRLYAVKTIPTPGVMQRLREDVRATVFCVSEFQAPDRFVPRWDITAETLFPEYEFASDGWMRVFRAQPLGDRTLYIGAGEGLPPGLFLASSLEKSCPVVRHIALPDGNRPLDWVVYDNHVYVLTKAEATDGAEVRVFRFDQENLSEREEVLHFRAPTLARSFEILNGDFYFGLGCQVDDSRAWDRKPLPPATGDILRVKAEFVR
jgi:hypothetical protein